MGTWDVQASLRVEDEWLGGGVRHVEEAGLVVELHVLGVLQVVPREQTLHHTHSQSNGNVKPLFPLPIRSVPWPARAYLVGCESCLVAHDVSEHAAEVPPAAHEGAAVQVVGQRGVRAVGPLVDARHGLVGPARTLGTEDHGRAERRAAGKQAGRHAGIGKSRHLWLLLTYRKV